MVPSVENEEYKLLYQECFTRYLNRLRPIRNPIQFGCRISALLYVLICLLWNKNRQASDLALFGKSKRINITAFIQNVSTIIELSDVISIPDPILNRIFINNRISGDCAVLTAEGPSHVDEITTEDFMKIPLKMDQFEHVFETFPVAIFGIVFLDGPLEDTIIHYFAIRKEGEGYVLISSYGSDIIEIGQYETPLDRGEFTNYVRQMTSDPRDMEFVSYFMKKYFLDRKKGVLFSGEPPMQYDAEGNKLGAKNTDVNIDAEINVYYGNRAGRFFHFEIVCFLHAVDQMSSLLKLSGGMRKKRTRKGKRTHYVRSRRNRSLSLHKK